MKTLLLLTILATLALGCSLADKASDLVTARQAYKLQLQQLEQVTK